MFDPESFLHTTTTDATSTEYVLIPPDVYTAAVTKVDVAQFDSGATALNVSWKIDSENEDADGRTVRHTVWLDMLGDALDSRKGKNRQLGLLREAVHQNTPGVSWSPNMLVGAVALITVGHRPDKNDPSRIYEDVRSVTAL